MRDRIAVFLSYASEDAGSAGGVCDALRAAGIEVWFDQNALRGGDAWDAEIRRQIKECTLFVPLVSRNTDARGEAYFRLEWKLAAERCQLQAQDQPFLLPVVVDETKRETARVPDVFRERQWMRLDGAAGLAELVLAVERLLPASGGGMQAIAGGNASGQIAAGNRATSRSVSPALSVCVLPFANMSGDPEQEYFSDGISEDIITDLSKVSALSVTARNTAFTFKGRAMDIKRVAGQLQVSHVLEGSVRKAGGRVRITAQLIDGATGLHVWAERYDRKLDDIFALQDEIATAIVAALRLKLLPEEKKAIERRGTTNPQAYKVYLMAHQMRLSGNVGSPRFSDAIVRLCTRAIEIDPGYARAWALMAIAQAIMRLVRARQGDGGRAAAERAVALDPSLADGHAAMAQILASEGQLDAAWREIEKAEALEPDSYEVNYSAARLCFQSERFAEASAYFKKASEMAPRDFGPAQMMVCCLEAMGEPEKAREASRVLLQRAERVALDEPDNGGAMNGVITALATLGEADRAREWIERALLLDPDNLNMRYNIACALANQLRDPDAALALLNPLTEVLFDDSVRWFKVDPDLDPIRDDPRFLAMIAAAEKRLANP